MVCLKLQFAIFILCFQSTIAKDLPLSLETYKNVHAIIELATINSSQIHTGGLIKKIYFQLVPILKKPKKTCEITSCPLLKGLESPKRFTNLPWGSMSSIFELNGFNAFIWVPWSPSDSKKVCENPYLSKSHQD